MRGKTVSFDEAISGVLLYEIATLLVVAALLHGLKNQFGVIPWLDHGIQ
ncbi:hypothetical protein RAMDARK_1124 [Rickettsia amblyommatis str. Darkwater]|uniref:Uncharacterized protein n=1 Tax=Rickettsia amblyommatis str. Ac/Pa TaxID=1359164 RepID=A0A0F3N3W5_RICAM|nr:hypothetical protein APHACPA_1479 [Rickettsia amblyommatis str. Ac/Pa]KJV91211.1 hypothetical protein RAMDARK_1124 [Rickettsia amblyommatis str. Darkwater]